MGFLWVALGGAAGAMEKYAISLLHSGSHLRQKAGAVDKVMQKEYRKFRYL